MKQHFDKNAYRAWLSTNKKFRKSSTMAKQQRQWDKDENNPVVRLKRYKEEVNRLMEEMGYEV